MPTITLKTAWTYRTPAVTIDYGAGTHEVAPAVHAEAVKQGVHAEEGNDDDNGAAKTGPARATRKAQG